MCRVHYYEKVSNEMRLVNVRVPLGSYSEYLSDYDREVLSTLNAPEIEAQVLCKKEDEWQIAGWSLKPFGEGSIILFRDRITEAVDDYIYDHEESIVK